MKRCAIFTSHQESANKNNKDITTQPKSGKKTNKQTNLTVPRTDETAEQ